MTYEEAVERVEALRDRMLESAADLQKGSGKLALERERDGQALNIVLSGIASIPDDVCPTCGV